MARKSKLLAALDAHKGRDYEAEKRAKRVKAAEKRKLQRAQFLDEGSEAAAIGEKNVAPTEVERRPQEQETDPTLAGDEFEAFSDDENENEEQEGEEAANDEGLTSDDDPESDVPLSELSEEDRADTIPHQRLTINNTKALLASTKRVAITHPKMKFSAHNSLILTSLPPASTSIPDPNDDLTRELEFYRICRTAATEARSLLKKRKSPSRDQPTISPRW